MLRNAYTLIYDIITTLAARCGMFLLTMDLGAHGVTNREYCRLRLGSVQVCSHTGSTAPPVGEPTCRTEPMQSLSVV